MQSSHGRPLNSESTSSSYSALCTAFVPLCTLDTRSNDDGSREVLNAVRRHPRFVNSRADAEIRPVNASTRLQSSSTSSASSTSSPISNANADVESCTSVDMAVTLNDLKRSFPPLVLASLAGELIAPGQYLGDEVIRLVLAVLRLSYPRTHILLLNACESLAAVQMDTVPGYAEELLAIVPDRVDREVGACHYAVLHLCFGSGNKQAFARYYDSLEGQLCLAVAQNLADLLWALGGFESLPERRPVVQRFPCPRQNAPNCALHAALICRALYLDTNISVVTSAAVAHFRKSLGDLLQQCRQEFPSFLQLQRLPWPDFTQRHFRGSSKGLIVTTKPATASSFTNVTGNVNVAGLEYAPQGHLTDGKVKQGKSSLVAPSVSIAVQTELSNQSHCAKCV